jgi:hypothetical protein
MPLFELAAMPLDSVDVTFSSHAISDISRYFMTIGPSRAARSLSDLIARSHYSLRLAEMRRSGWNKHKMLGGDEVECLYWIGK